MKETHTFTCIGKGHGAPALPATRQEWEQLRNEPWLAEMCRRILNGDERLKSRLPIWTPVCAAFRNNHRAVADALQPLNRLMLDFDEKGHSQEILTRSMQLKAEGKWDILLVEESVRRGTHVLITLPEGMTPQEAQQRFSDDVGFQADPALKDVARCIYMVPASHTLYVDDALFTINEDLRMKTAELDEGFARTNEELIENEERISINGELPSFPDTYEGIPYETLVQTLEEQMGGQPEHGSRNNFIFSMACHLRYVTNDDASWIARILPTYGESREKWMATIRSACARNQAKQMPRIMRRTLTVCKQRLEEDNPGLATPASELNAPPKMPRNLPPLIRLLVSKTPQIYRPAVAHAVFPALAAHLWRTTFRYIDNVEHEATLMCCLMAGTGAGKNCISEPINRILADIRQRDREN
ncbi:MAG: hypothetical protein IKW44_03650, partial [Bacteroidaceae bacterium]|nr:hypothetical protein [Bacteroidaceae bacterium]